MCVSELIQIKGSWTKLFKTILRLIKINPIKLKREREKENNAMFVLEDCS